MIAAMNKLAFLSMALLLGLSGCGGSSETATPPAAPTSQAEATPAPKAAEPAKAEIPATSKPEVAPPPAAKSEAAQPGQALPANAPEKKGCTGLKKDICKITLGCAWSTKGMCIATP